MSWDTKLVCDKFRRRMWILHMWRATRRAWSRRRRRRKPRMEEREKERDYTRCLFNLRGFRVLCLGFCCVALINSKSVLRVLPKRTNMRTRTLSHLCPVAWRVGGATHTNTHIYVCLTCPTACLLSLAAGCASLNYEKFLLRQLRQHSAAQTSIRVRRSSWQLPRIGDSWEMPRDSQSEFFVILWIWYQ